MKKITIILLVSAVISGCAASAKKVEHADLGGTTTADKRYHEDIEFCSAAYLDTQATTDEEKAEAKKMYQENTLAFKLLVTGIAMNHAGQTGEESAVYVDACMTEKGWVTW